MRKKGWAFPILAFLMGYSCLKRTGDSVGMAHPFSY